MLDFSSLGGLIGLHRQGRLSEDGYRQLAKLLMQENDYLHARIGRAERHAHQIINTNAEGPIEKEEVAREFLEILEE